MKKTLSFKYILIFLFPLSLLLTFFAARNPILIERFYSTGIYRIISKAISFLSMLIPISMGEILLYVFILWVLWAIINFCFRMLFRTSNRKKILLKGLVNSLIYFSVLYFIFITIWGLNYHRLPFSKIANLDTQPTSIEVLELLCKDLITRANHLRENVEEDKNGITHIPNGFKSVSQRAFHGFRVASQQYPELGGRLSPPKGVLLSNGMSHAGIAGIYFPFTGEANVNTLIPDAMLPSTTSHEMAHQRGFAREDEANYIAYVVSTQHPDTDFQYSGVLLALIHSMNALYKYDVEKYIELTEEYNDGLKRDLKAIKSFWDHYEGPVERASTKLNNAYLKSNLQEEGIKSYGRMVDLLIAEYQSK